MTRHRGPYMPFFVVLLLLIILGFFVFVSGALGLVSREGGAKFSAVIVKQVIYGGAGIVAMYLAYKAPVKIWRKFAPAIFIASLLFTLLVFVPGIGASHGGATRWLDIGPVSVQPGEFLKLGFVVYFAAWLSAKKEKVATFWGGVVPLLVFLGITTGILLLQPHTGMAVIIFLAALGMFLAGGGKIKHLLVLLAIGMAGLLVVALFRPHVASRLSTFWALEKSDPFGAGYQIRQSLIAIGSGELIGKGFGQSAQKFDYLPEAIGDSIFAVAAEEFGFFGTTTIVILFLLFALSGFKIASKSTDSFGRLLVVGLVILIVSQSYINMAAMLGLLPLSGIPVLFISQGGTALFFTLVECGIILSVSRRQS